MGENKTQTSPPPPTPQINRDFKERHGDGKKSLS